MSASHASSPNLRMIPRINSTPPPRFPMPNTADASLQKSISRKRLSIGAFHRHMMPLIPPPIFEHFMIVGAPYNNIQDPQPAILFLFPPSPLFLSHQDLNQTVNMCFPGQYKQLKPNFPTQLMNEFVFQISGTERPAYGVCVEFSVNSMPSVFFATQTSKSYPFCFCLITSSPVLSTHFQFLTYLVLQVANGFKTTIPRKPLPYLFSPPSEGDTLPHLELLSGVARWPGMKILKQFRQELIYYRSLRLNEELVQTYDLTDKLTLTIPSATSDAECIANVSLDVLFSQLSIRNIVKLYTALLLEHHTIFICPDTHVLSMSVLAARTILKPFKISATLLPIIPEMPEYLELLDSPVPYIVGLLSASALNGRSLPEQLCIVNLATDKVKDKSLKFSLPGEATLIRKLTDALEELSSFVTCPPKYAKGTQVSPDFIRFIQGIHPLMRPSLYLASLSPKYVFVPNLVTKILKIFSENLAPSLEFMMKPCFVTDTTNADQMVTIFNTELFLASVKPEDSDFFNAFSNTTIFNEFCEGKTDELEMTRAMEFEAGSERSLTASDSEGLMRESSSFDTSLLIAKRPK